MLDSPTVFVIGAGAGFDIGMPLGDRLSELIADAVNCYFDRGDQTKGKTEIWKAVNRIAQRTNVSSDLFLTAGRRIATGIKYARSIDNYVHTHSDSEEVKAVAKVAIVHTIIAAERQSAIWLDSGKMPFQFNDEVLAHKSWLSDFFMVLQDAVIAAKSLDRIFDNLTIINFNYDRCIDHYLYYVMQRLYSTKDEPYVRDLLNSSLKILHPYGAVGYLPWQSPVKAVRFGGEPIEDDIAEISSGIRTYNEEIEDKNKIEEVRMAMASAKRIVFLGFHFHKQNVELLSQEADLPALRGTVSLYGTRINRSGADMEIIQNRRMPRILHGRTELPSSSYLTECDCKKFFKDFGGMLAG
jgi:hypothetical protein